MRGLLGGAAVAAVAAACASAPPPGDGRPVIEELRSSITSVEVPELDVYESASDRFAACPPPGKLGQSWVPEIPSASEVAAAPSAKPRQETGSVSFAIAAPDAPAGDEAPTHERRGRAEQVITSMRGRFRDCWHRGLFDDPTQNGHVALALRVARDGRVASVDAYAACELSSAVVTCLRDAAKDVRFDASDDDDTVIVPLVFSERPRLSAPSATDAYTAAAFVTLEAARPALRACAAEARKGGGSPTASATFALDVDAHGKVLHAHVDRFEGDKGELLCAAKAIGALAFPPPASGQAYVIAHVAIDPPLGTK